MSLFRKPEPKQPPFGGIALVGEPGSGKTSIAKELMDILGCERMSFAGPLKNEVAYALAGSRIGAFEDGWLLYLDLLNDPNHKDLYRPLLQAWGSLARAQNEDYWADRLEDDIVPGSVYVIDDCRYFNEYDMLRRHGFRFVYLKSGETTRHLTDEQSQHESERDWPQFACDLVLSYIKGPKLQAKRIVDLLGIEGGGDVRFFYGGASAGTGTFIEDSLPEDDECNCSVDEDGNCDCDGCTDGFEVISENDYPGGVATITVSFDPPYTGDMHVHYDIDEVAVPI